MATTPGLVRPSLTAPALSLPATRPIRFLHPGYDAPNNVLFRLARVDAAPSHSTTLGVCHATALVACQIVANNAWSGRLALDRQGTQLIGTALDDVLVSEEYYFIVAGTPSGLGDQDVGLYCLTISTGIPIYPIVPSFRDWPFPHDHLPAFWPSVPVSSHAPESCILTDSSYAKTEAHLVPREEGDWFKYNSMGQYGLDRKDTEDSANLANLRGDIHTWLDARGWTIAPKATPDGYRYVANVLDTVQAPEFFSWYHNVQLRLSGRQPSEYIFARFAWTIIQLVKPFVLSLSPRAVVHVQTDPEKAVTWVVETMQFDQLDQLYGGGGSRSASPNKRRKQSSTRNSSAYNDGLSFDAEVKMIYNRITADHEARVYQQNVERATVYERIKSSAIKRRRNSDSDDCLEEWEDRGRPRKRRSWTTDNDDGASAVSTVASLGRNSCSTVPSDPIPCHSSPIKEEEGSFFISAPPEIDSYVDGEAPEIPPELGICAPDVHSEGTKAP